MSQLDVCPLFRIAAAVSLVEPDPGSSTFAPSAVGPLELVCKTKKAPDTGAFSLEIGEGVRVQLLWLGSFLLSTGSRTI